MESYFQLTPSILSESGEYGGGIQIQVTLKQTYNGYNGDSIADITLTPKDSNLPTLYLNIAWGKSIGVYRKFKDTILWHY